ncbi:hypothetical protein MIND_01075400 [Mycena indigotica]|uniref:Uncharacterized protein n=1 Tax=Mycena indigotica TaxID=2126181 RepID=A0A8H6W0X5_9AGAR|nr:uncharacterized protein MIND_01075400 [Mycena indigotica]KAF7295359.1 hypothetical protein MIND_01075400 [Mycena indigotica]
MNFDPLPPVSDLPQNVQANIQTEYHNRRPELENIITRLLEKPYTIDVELCAAWPYARRNGNSNLGVEVFEYFEGFTLALERFVSWFGEAGKRCFNGVVVQQKICLKLNPLHGRFASPVSQSVDDGIYSILFHPDWFGRAQCVPRDHFTVEGIQLIIDRLQVPLNLLGNSFNLFAQRSINVKYDTRLVEATRRHLSELLGTSVFLNPNWGEVYSVLQAAKMPITTIDLGACALERFTELYEQLKELPEMHHPATRQQLQHLTGSATEVRIQILDQNISEFNPVVLEPGIMWIQFTPDGFCDGFCQTGSSLLECLTSAEINVE